MCEECSVLLKYGLAGRKLVNLNSRLPPQCPTVLLRLVRKQLETKSGDEERDIIFLSIHYNYGATSPKQTQCNNY